MRVKRGGGAGGYQNRITFTEDEGEILNNILNTLDEGNGVADPSVGWTIVSNEELNFIISTGIFEIEEMTL
tara:strand:- start:68578 stop:68790 length:213 start_codon:yes stop_codon:yes gene_type:complete